MVGPAVAERLAPAIFEAFAAAGTTTVLAYGVVYEAAMDAAFRPPRRTASGRSSAR